MSECVFADGTIIRDYEAPYIVAEVNSSHNGNMETAKQMIDRFYLGIGGVLTFKNAKKLVDVVREISLEHLVLETDCPYMAPTPYRGKRNEPIYTKEVAMKIAEIKGISYEKVVEVTNKNTRKAYGML